MTTRCLNAGSSSLKFCVYRGRRTGPGASRRAARSRASARRRALGEGRGRRAARGREARRVGARRARALESLAGWLRSRYGGARVLGVGHRVVHGGACTPARRSSRPRSWRSCARSSRWRRSTSRTTWRRSRPSSERLPGVPQVACFDTSFHRGRRRWPSWSRCRARSAAAGVQRYGFHGLSYEYIASVLPEMAPEIARGRVIVAHLGSGAERVRAPQRQERRPAASASRRSTACAWARGPARSIPAWCCTCSRASGSPRRKSRRCSTRSRACWAFPASATTCATSRAAASPSARLAVDYFVYRAAREIGGLAAVLGGIDGLVFTAGIGENSAEIRRADLRGRAPGSASSSTRRRTPGRARGSPAPAARSRPG